MKQRTPTRLIPLILMAAVQWLSPSIALANGTTWEDMYNSQVLGQPSQAARQQLPNSIQQTVAQQVAGQQADASQMPGQQPPTSTTQFSSIRPQASILQGTVNQTFNQGASDTTTGQSLSGVDILDESLRFQGSPSSTAGLYGTRMSNSFATGTGMINNQMFNNQMNCSNMMNNQMPNNAAMMNCSNTMGTNNLMLNNAGAMNCSGLMNNQMLNNAGAMSCSGLVSNQALNNTNLLNSCGMMGNQMNPAMMGNAAMMNNAGMNSQFMINNQSSCNPAMGAMNTSLSGTVANGLGLNTQEVGAIGAATMIGVFMQRGGLGGILRSMNWDPHFHTRGMSIGGY